MFVVPFRDVLADREILVCEVCKGDHETNSTICPGFDPNQQAVCFKGHGCVMSNMYPCIVPYKGKNFSSSEHAYQWEKALGVGQKEKAQDILEAPDGYAAKKISKTLDPNAVYNWRTRYGVATMKKIAQAKFDNVEEFRKEMIDSKGMYIIEALCDDTFWAVGFLREIGAFCKPQYWPGQNVMGRILMEVRDKYLGMTKELLPFDEIGKMLPHRSLLVDPLLVEAIQEE